MARLGVPTSVTDRQNSFTILVIKFGFMIDNQPQKLLDFVSFLFYFSFLNLISEYPIFLRASEHFHGQDGDGRIFFNFGSPY